jgi:SAM-dependent methyltransferase
MPRFVRDCRRYRKAAPAGSPFPLRLRDLKPILVDYFEQAGSGEGHYFYQDLWAARKVYEARPERHLDIGSRIDGFVAHVLTFMPVEVIDIRPLSSKVRGLTFRQADATNLADIPDGSVESLSSLHVVEHFGLGRYTDPVDPQACFAAMRAMQRVVRPGGKLYFSVPVGRERVEFNAHRVFAPGTVLSSFPELELRSFAAVNDAGEFLPDCRPDDVAGARFACGMFEFARSA